MPPPPHLLPGPDEAVTAPQRPGQAAISPDAEGGPVQGELLGRFVVLERIGQGGMGTVYAAWDPRLGRRVALKVLRGAAGSDEVARILREARTLAQLSHPNVVRVYELGELGQAPFIAMELVEGSSLRDVAKGRPSPERVLDLFLAAGRGLAAVHGLGLVHRDFKPANVLVGQDGRVCVGDFGLAISHHEEDSGRRPRPVSQDGTPSFSAEPVTQHGLVLGTPGYMAPEQLRGEVVDARCDQFAFAISLWTALFGERPFPRDSVDFPAPPRPRGRSLTGRALERVLRRALAVRREDRFPTMDALLAALEHARHRARRLAGGAAVAAGLALVLGAVVPGLVERDPCRVQARVTEAFPSALRERLRTSATQGRAPEDIAAHIDAYTGQWRSAAQTVCHRQDLPARPAVEACLDRRLGDLTALVEVLASQPGALDNALPAVLALPSPLGCLTSTRGPVPVAPGSSEQALERKLSDARATWLSGQAAQALEQARAVAAAAQAVDDGRLEAEARYVLGNAAVETGDLKAAEEALRASVAGAMRVRDDRLEALAWSDLLNVVGDRARRFEEAQRWLALEQAAVARAGEDLDVLVRARFAESLLFQGMGDLSRAEPLALESVQLADRRVPRDPRLSSRVHGARGNLLASKGDLDGGVAELLTARRSLEGALPPGHAAFGAVENNVGILYLRLGDLGAARASLERAVAAFSTTTRKPSIAVATDNLGQLSRLEGRLDEADQHFQRALELARDAYGRDHERTTDPLLGQAQVLADRGRFAEAGERLEEVLRVRRKNAHTRTTLEALLINAQLVWESGAPPGKVEAAVEAVRSALQPLDDLTGTRLELALLQAARAVEAGNLPAALASLESAKGGEVYVAWPGYQRVWAGWKARAEGQAPSLEGLPLGVPLARRLLAVGVPDAGVEARRAP